MRWLCLCFVLSWSSSLCAQADEAGWYYVQPGTLPPKDAKIVKGPDVAKRADGGYAISFEVDKPCDVAVRIVDAKDKTVRHIAAGVVGWKDAPEPFVPEKLVQTVQWDGKDDAGRQVSGMGLKVRVDVCVQARLDRFLGWHPGAVKGMIFDLDIDREGNLSIWHTQTTPLRDMSFVHTYDRGGEYVRTVIPFRADVPLERQRAAFTQLANNSLITFAKIPSGKIVPNACLPFSGNEKTNAMLGYSIFICTRDDGQPFGRFSDGRILFMPWNIGFSGAPHVLTADGVYPNPPQFLAWPHGCRINAFIAADDSFYLLPMRGAGNHKDGHAVYKYNGKTLKPAEDFQFAGKDKLDKPTAILGTKGVAGTDEKHLNSPSDVAVDREGNVFVSQFSGRLVKFRKDGMYLTEWQLAFGEIRGVSCGKFPPEADTIYVLGTDKAGKVKLMKFLPSTGQTVWETTLVGADRGSIRGGLTVDTSKTPTVVWVGGGNGLGSFSRIEDAGTKIGVVKHFQPISEGVLLQPYRVVADVDADAVFVADINRDVAVRIRASDGGDLTELPATKYSGHSHNANMAIDRQRKRLFFTAAVPKALPCLNYQGEPQAFPTIGGRAIDAQGNIYALRLQRTVKEVSRKQWAVGNEGASIWQDPKTVFTQLVEHVLTKEETLGPAHLCWVRGSGWKGDVQRTTFSWSLVSKYDVNGNLVREDYARPMAAVAGLVADSRGFVYAMDSTNYDVHCYGWGKYRRYPREANHVIKFAPGGVHGGEGEVWRRRGVSPVLGTICGCGPKGQLSIDEFDRIFATDALCHNIKVFDTAGNLIAVIGSYGNEDCAGPGSAVPEPEIGLCQPNGVDATKDWCFIADTNNGRIVKCRLVYGDSMTRSIE